MNHAITDSLEQVNKTEHQLREIIQKDCDTRQRVERIQGQLDEIKTMLHSLLCDQRGDLNKTIYNKKTGT